MKKYFYYNKEGLGHFVKYNLTPNEQFNRIFSAYVDWNNLNGLDLQ